MEVNRLIFFHMCLFFKLFLAGIFVFNLSIGSPVDDLKTKLAVSDTAKQLEIIHTLPYDFIIANHQELIPILLHYEKSAKENKAYLAKLYVNLSLAYYYNGKYDENLKYGLKAIHVYETLNDQISLGFMYGELGYQMKRRDLSKAFGLMRKGIAILEKQQDVDKFSSIYNNYGVLFEMKLELDSAIYFYKKALSVKERLNDSLGMPYSLNNIFEVKILMNKPDEAIQYLHRSTLIREKRQDSLGLAINYCHYAKYYAEKNKPDSSVYYYDKAIPIALKHNYIFLIQNIYSDMALQFEKQKKYSQSLLFYKKYKEYSDSLINIETNKAIADLQIKFETEEKEKALLFERAEKERIESEKLKAQLSANKRQKWIWIVSSAGILFVLLALIAMQRNKRLAQEEKNNAIIHEQEKGMVAIINAQEEERIRVAKDLHDGLGQQLSALSLHFQLLAKKITGQNASFQMEIEKIKNMIVDTAKDVRFISHQMMPKALTELGLREALEDMTQATLSSAGIQVLFTSDEFKERLPKTMEIGLYRIAQELITNIVKHSKAKQVSVFVRNLNSSIVLEVNDDGIGIDSSTFEGIGMLSIQSRVNALKGRFVLSTAPGKGTKAIVKIKLKENVEQAI